MRALILLTIILCSVPSAWAQVEPEPLFVPKDLRPQTEPNLRESWTDPVPDDLRRLRGEELAAQYKGVTRYGTYRLDTPRSTTRNFTEIHDPDGRTQYREGDFRSTGDWFITEDDRLCYVYDEAPTTEHCFYEFISGTCIFSYSIATPDGESPLNPQRWGGKSVAKGQVSTCDMVIG